MSFKLSREIMSCQVGNRTAKFVLRCLADYLNDFEPEKGCWPATESLCRELETDRHAVYRALDFLKKHDWITVQKRRTLTLYFLNLEKIAKAQNEPLTCQVEPFVAQNVPKGKKSNKDQNEPSTSHNDRSEDQNEPDGAKGSEVQNEPSTSHSDMSEVQVELLDQVENQVVSVAHFVPAEVQNVPPYIKDKEYIIEKESNKEKDSVLANIPVEQKSRNLASEKSQHSDYAKNPTSSQSRVIPEVEELFNVKSSPYTKESALDSENAKVTNLAEEKNSTGSTVVNDFNFRADSNENLSLFKEAPLLNNSDNANGTTTQPVEATTIQQTPSCVRETNNTPNNSDNHGASPTASQTTMVTCTTEDKESASESNEPPSCVKGDSSQNNHETLWTGTSVEELALCDNLFGFEDEPSTPVKSKKSKNHKCAYDGSYELLHPKTKKMVRIEADFVRVEKPEEVEEQVWNDFIAYRRKKSKTAYITENVIENYREISDQTDFSLEEVIQNCIDRDWQGIKSADWLLHKPPKPKGYTGEYRYWRDLCFICNDKHKPLTKSRIDDLLKSFEVYKVPLNKGIECCAKKGLAVFVYSEYLKWLAEEEGKKVQTNFAPFTPNVDNSEKVFFGKFSSVGA